MAAATAERSAYQLKAEQAEAAAGTAKQTMEVRLLLRCSDRALAWQLPAAYPLKTRRSYRCAR